MSAAARDHRKPSPTILVVEPMVLVRMMIAQYLRECQYKVIEAATAKEALQILEDGRVSVDVVFTEVELPGELDGFSLAQWVRGNKPSIQALLVGTITGAANAARRLCEEGSFVAKPYAHHTVAAEIKRLLAAAERGLASAKTDA